MLSSHLLTMLIGLSGLGSLLILLLNNAQHSERSYYASLIVVTGCCLLGIGLFQQFDPVQPGLQLQESYIWIKAWNIRYAIGVDGLSLSFILLTIFITTLATLSVWQAQPAYASQYLSALLFTQTFIIGAFAATDAIFFYLCWESVLIPILLTIGIWGSQGRAYASIKFFLYTFISSAGLLIAVLYLGHQQTPVNFDIRSFYTLKLTLLEQKLLFLSCFIAFTIKIPLWPFHTWLPDAHTEAPTEGSIMLAALMLKLGGYGLLRFCLPIMPDASQQYAFFICSLSLVAIIYAGLIALTQTDMKRLIAYASISHMGIVVLGIFIVFLSPALLSSNLALSALQGAVVQMLSHALSTTGMFLSIGYLYQRFHSRELPDYQGLATLVPKLSGMVLLFLLSMIGLPGTAGFIGEFLIIMSAARAHMSLAILAATTLILSAAYALWFYGRVFGGQLHHPAADNINDIQPLEKFICYLLVIAIFLIGLWPSFLLTLTENTLQQLLSLSFQSKL